MSDISVNLDPRLLSPLRVMELSALAAGSMPTRPALDDPVAAVSSVPPAPIAADPRQGASPPTMTLAVPPSPERLRPDALTAHATASSLQTRQTSYAEIDRTLAATSSALRRVDSPVDVPRTLTDLTARLETRRGEEAQAIGLAVNRVNELTDQIAHADARDAASSPERAAASAADPLYRRDVALQTLAKLTGAQATPGSGGAPQEPLNVSVHGVPLIADGVPVRLGLGSDATGRLVVTTGDGTVLPMDSGVIGGRLQLANEVLPQVIRGVFALSAVIGGVQADDAGAAASASASALEAVAAQARAGKAAPAVAAFLDAVRTGSVLQPTASLVSGYLGAIDPGEGARQAAQISSLQQINQVTARLGTAADAVASAVASNAATLVQSSAPQVASGEVVGPTVPGSVSFAVLSAASAAAVVSELEFVPDRPLGGGQPFSFGLLTSDDKGTPTHTVFEMMPPAGIADVVAAINRSGTQVRATLSNLGSGAMQLNLVSLSTGRFSSVVVTNAQQPPVSSMVLGRFTRLMDARDTVLRVDSGPQAGTLAVSTSPQVSGLMEGVTVSVQQADPTKVVTLTTTPDPRALVSKVDAVITSAAGVLAGVWQATQAGTPLAGDRMLGDLAGRVMGAVTGVPPVGGMPGLGLRGGGMSFDRETFLRSFAKDPAGTETQVAATAVRLSSVATAASDPAAGYLAVRLAAAQNLRQGYSAPKAAPEERLTGRTLELKRRESSLESLLGHLHGQGDWLRSELAGTAAGTTSPAGAWLPPVEPVPADRRQPA